MKPLRIIVSLLVLSLFAAALPALAQEDLTESFSTGDGSLTFNYPAGWHAEEFFVPGLAVVGNSEAAVLLATNSDAEIPAGDVALMILGPQAFPLLFEEGIPTSLDGVLVVVLENGEGEFGEPESATLAGYEALILSATAPNYDGMVFLLDVDGDYMLVTAIAAPGEYDQFAATVLAVVNSLTYVVPEGLITFESSGITFDYPAGWYAIESSPGMAIVGNSSAVISVINSGDELAAGDVLLAILGPQTSPLVFKDVIPTSLDEALAAVMNEDAESEYGEPKSTTLAGYDALMVTATEPGLDGMVFVLNVDGDYMLVTAVAASGEYDQAADMVLAIVDTLDYDAPER